MSDTGVQLATQAWGFIVSKDDASNVLTGRPGIPFTITNIDESAVSLYQDSTLTTLYAGSRVSQSDGTLPGYIKRGTYWLTVDGKVRRVEASSGASDNPVGVVPSNLQISGHSYMDPQGIGITNGQGLNPNPYAAAARTAALLGVQMGQVQNLAKSGATLRSHKNNGAARYLQLINPGQANLWPIFPKSGVHVAWWGTNDMILGSGGFVQKGFTNGYRALISRYRASAVFDYNDATVSSSGTWVDTLYTDPTVAMGSGGGCSGSTVVNSQKTITLPSAITQDGQSRTVALGFVTSAHGGTFEIKKDGVLQGTTATSGCNYDDTEFGSNVFRLKVNPGDSQITIKLTSVDAGHYAYFDYWQVESDYPPLFLMVECTVPPSPPSLWNGVNPTNVTAFNGYLKGLVTEFGDGAVQVVPVDEALGGLTIRANGQYGNQAANYRFYQYTPPSFQSLHPNDLGAQVVAEQVVEAVRVALALGEVLPRQLAGYDANSEKWPLTSFEAEIYGGDGAPLQILDAFDGPDSDITPAGWTALAGGWGIRGKQLALVHDLAPVTYTDDFERSDDSTHPGAGWTAVHGTWGISSGELKCFASATPQGIVLSSQQLDVNGDGGLEFMCGTVLEDWAGLVFRYQNDTNFWLLAESVTFGSWSLYKVVSGTPTTVRAGTSQLGSKGATGARDKMNVELHGSRIQVWNNDVLLTDITDSALQTARGVGLAGSRTASDTTGPTFPYFSCRAGPNIPDDIHPGFAANAIVRDLGFADGSFQFTVGVDSPLNWKAAVFRYVDESNYLFLFESSTFGSWGFHSKIAGTVATVATFTSRPNPGDLMQVTMKGNTIGVYKNGTLLGSNTIGSCPQGTLAGFSFPTLAAGFANVAALQLPARTYNSAYYGPGTALVNVPDTAYYRDNQTGDMYGPYSKGVYGGVLRWLPTLGARTVEVNTAGLTSAQVDALFPVAPPNGTALSDPTNNLSLVRQAGLWRKIATSAL